MVETNQLTFNEAEEKFFNRIMFEELHDVPSGSNIDVTVWIAKNIADRSDVNTYSGNNGSEYENFPNPHMGLFKLDTNPQSQNGTSVYSGHIPELYYYLL